MTSDLAASMILWLQVMYLVDENDVTWTIGVSTHIYPNNQEKCFWKSYIIVQLLQNNCLIGANNNNSKVILYC